MEEKRQWELLDGCWIKARMAVERERERGGEVHALK